MIHQNLGPTFRNHCGREYFHVCASNVHMRRSKWSMMQHSGQLKLWWRRLWWRRWTIALMPQLQRVLQFFQLFCDHFAGWQIDFGQCDFVGWNWIGLAGPLLNDWNGPRSVLARCRRKWYVCQCKWCVWNRIVLDILPCINSSPTSNKCPDRFSPNSWCLCCIDDCIDRWRGCRRCYVQCFDGTDFCWLDLLAAWSVSMILSISFDAASIGRAIGREAARKEEKNEKNKIRLFVIKYTSEKTKISEKTTIRFGWRRKN